MSVLIGRDALRDFAGRLLEGAGVESAKAALVADNLVAANLRGVDSHGVQLLSYYLEQLAAGDIDHRATGSVASENGPALVYDAKNALGAVVSEICCRHVVRLANHHGMAMVVSRNSNHFGMAAYWARRISAAGHMAIVVCNASPMVPPWQAREPRFCTYQICVSLPGQPDQTWLLDMASTTVAMGKIYKAHFNNEPSIPPGWGLDKQGRPTTETGEVINGGMVAPLGGYKGYGLAMFVEILCAVLGGGAMSTEVGGIRIRGRPMSCSQAFIAIDIGLFLPPDQFAARMQWLVETVKQAAPAAGYSEVLIAGEPENKMEAVRSRDGIPIPEGTWTSLQDAAQRLGVAVPVTSS